MNKKYSKDIMFCPNCNGVFVNRIGKKCPFCKIELVYPGEYISSDSDGFIWLSGWKKIKDLNLDEARFDVDIVATFKKPLKGDK